MSRSIGQPYQSTTVAGKFSLTEGLDAGGTVDAFAEQARVAIAAGVLLHHVNVDPAEAGVLLTVDYRQRPQPW